MDSPLIRFTLVIMDMVYTYKAIQRISARL